MPFLPDTLTATATDFEGPWDPSFIDPTDIALPKGMLAMNAAYLPGKVAIRLGHSAVFIDSTAVNGFTSFINWLFEYNSLARNFMIAFAKGVGVQISDMANPIPSLATLIPDTASYGSYASPSGLRAYVATYDHNGAGTSGGYVFGFPAASAGFPGSVDHLFMAPIAPISFTVTEGSTGDTTAGLHRFGFLLTSRSGYITRFSPVDGSGVFAPVSFTSAGGTILTLAINAVWPNEAAALQIIMTTAANPSQYYIVPGTIFAVVGGITSSVTIQINISDGDLAATGSDPSPYQFLLTQWPSGTAPFFPRSLVNYSNRMGYNTIDKSGYPVIYFSDPQNYQSITADQHGVYLPGNLQIVTGQPIQATCYIFGPHWTYSVSDTGDVPATWASAQLVDGSIGTLSKYGVYVNASQSFAWVADEGGLFLFQGSAYPARPISYYNTPDWKRINWAIPDAVQVVDDKNAKVVKVFAPLDANTQPSHILSWDYTLGQDPEEAHYSLDNIFFYQMGAGAIFENPTTRTLETWIAPGAAAMPILRKNTGKESQPYRDWNASVDFKYQTALFPGESGQSGTLNMFHNVRTRARGFGFLSMSVFGLDGTLMFGPFTVPLTTSPGQYFDNRFFMMSEAMSLLMEMDAIDNFCEISLLEVAYTEGPPQR